MSDLEPSPGPLVVLGGTFDPPHFGHLLLAECARHQFGAHAVLFVPAGEPYRKAHRKVTPAVDRLAMTRLAIAGNDAFGVDDREVRRPGPTYTVDTLEELHAEGQRQIILVLGEDAVADMPHWKEPARIRELATIAVALKPGIASGAAALAGRSFELLAAASDQSRLAPRLKESTYALTPRSTPARTDGDPIVAMPPLAISSTLVRERVRTGEPIRYLVPDIVERYIHEHGLYV